MRQKHQFTDQEKIKLFDKVHDEARNELNGASTDEENDVFYFWESTMVNILDITTKDWAAHNTGHQF
jgi:hypothetical protein